MKKERVVMMMIIFLHLAVVVVVMVAETSTLILSNPLSLFCGEKLFDNMQFF